MPAKSKAQLRAMYAAAEGKSTLGIPKSVGKDFAEATPTAKGLPERKGKKKKRKPGDHPGAEARQRVYDKARGKR